MFRAMITKELRSTLPIAAIGLVLIGLLANSVLSRTGREFPLLDGEFLADWSTAAWLLAIALGLSQSAWERKRGTDLFLLHRPARCAALLAVKVAVGAVLLELAAGLPALMGGFSLSGRHRYAGDLLFAWWMTEPVWRVWLRCRSSIWRRFSAECCRGVGAACDCSRWPRPPAWSFGSTNSSGCGGLPIHLNAAWAIRAGWQCSFLAWRPALSWSI